MQWSLAARPTAVRQTLEATRDSGLHHSPANVLSVVSAADDNYAMPLAVTIRSAIDRLAHDDFLDLYILDGGLTDISRASLCRSWHDPRVTIQFLRPDQSRIRDLKTENHLNLVTYLRLFMPELLPPHLKQVIFLDADLLVLHNLRDLWCVPLEGAPVAAVRDYFRPFLNTRQTLGRSTMCDHAPHEPWPIPNYRELGLSGQAAYFNAGVMLVNLDYWRAQQVLTRAIDLTERHQQHVRFCDQYALNVLFSGRWRELDVRWNQSCNVYGNAREEGWALEADQLALTRQQPWIVHFTWLNKPWHPGCKHPFTPRFFKVVDRTAWRGWRPPREPFDFRQLPGHVYQSYRRWRQKNVSPWLRALKQRLLGRRQAA